MLLKRVLLLFATPWISVHVGAEKTLFRGNTKDGAEDDYTSRPLSIVSKAKPKMCLQADDKKLGIKECDNTKVEQVWNFLNNGYLRNGKGYCLYLKGKKKLVMVDCLISDNSEYKFREKLVFIYNEFHGTIIAGGSKQYPTLSLKNNRVSMKSYLQSARTDLKNQWIVNPTIVSTSSPTSNPISNPTSNPTSSPTPIPTPIPTSSPTSNPTSSPTSIPTPIPTPIPTSSPTSNPTSSPTSNPTSSPTSNPTSSPASNPTSNPTKNPTSKPNVNPTTNPTLNPTKSPNNKAPCQTLYEAIAKDNMPPSSIQCTSSSGSTSSDFNFVSSQVESKWFDGYEESFEKYNAPWSQLEQYVFNAKMTHTDISVNRTWTIRLGTGGNIYSLVGPMGETVSPQKRVDSPWIDEVWHSVSTDSVKNRDPSNDSFMIHGAGSYQSDDYPKNKGIALTEIPFYAPSLGKYCNDEDGECGFISWPQHGPVPVDHKSTIINFNRYKNCGDGVIEHTTVIHNNMGSGSAPTRIDAPFGSIRFSNLRDVVVTHNGVESVIEPHELQRYDQSGAFKEEAKDSLGYAVFAEDLPSKNSGPYTPLNSKIKFKIHSIGCRNAPDLWGYPAVMCRLEETIADMSSTRVALTFRGTPKEIALPCSTKKPSYCITRLKFIKYNDGKYCSPFGTGTGVKCRLDSSFLDDFVNAGGDANIIHFRTDSGKIFTASNGVSSWAYESNGVYSLLYTRSDSDTSLDDINTMIGSDDLAAWNIEIVPPPEAGGDIHAKNGVAIWVQQIESTNAFWTYFFADEVPGVSNLGAYVAKKFPPGSTLEVLYHTGRAVEDNTALAHVYGNNFDGVRGLTPGWPIVIIGNANEGKKPRDLNVYNVVTTANKNTAGGIHFYRQYFVIDRFSDISSTAAFWANEVITDNYNINNESAPLSRTVDILTEIDGTSIRAVVGKSGTTGSVCTGTTTPNANSKALFHVKCGEKTYIGADQYHFARFMDGKFMPYTCKNDKTARGVWNLLGFFPENACAKIKRGYTFSEEENTCVTE